MLAILIATSTGIAAATPVATRLAPVQSTASAAPVTELVIDSDLTDPIGVGEHRTYTLSNSTFRLEEVTEDAHGVPNWISMYVNGSQPNDYWEITFTSRQTDRPLAVGFYERAEEAALGESGHPGLAVRGQDRNCRLLIGRFTVEDLRYTSGALEGFAISFEQHCDRNEPALRGHLYYNYTAPATVTFAPAEVLGGQSSVATVTLAAPAPAGGTTVDLVTNHPELATVPRTITVPEGAVLAEFPVTTDVQKYVTEAEVLATVAGVAAHARLSVVSPIASLTALDMKSDRGDYIGAGATYRLTPGTGRFAVYGVRVPGSDGLAMAGFSYRSVGGPDTVWYGDFSTARLGAPMTPGLTYTGAQRANNEDAGHPGLNISGIGRGCNQLTGAFRVLALDLDTGYDPPVVLSLAVEFEQHCDGESPALHGTFYYRYTPTSNCSIASTPTVKAEAEATDGPRIGAHVAFATPTTDCRSSSVTCEPASGGFFPVGTTIVTCRADAGGELRGVGGFPVTVDSVRTFCAASDDNGDWFTEVIDRSSPLAGFWAYRVAESGKAYFGMAQRIKYRSGRSFVSSDSSSPRASMRVNFQLGPDGGGMIRITDRATGKRFILSDSRISDDPLCE